VPVSFHLSKSFTPLVGLNLGSMGANLSGRYQNDRIILQDEEPEDLKILLLGIFLLNVFNAQALVIAANPRFLSR
jgi:hypothetical protein